MCVHACMLGCLHAWMLAGVCACISACVWAWLYVYQRGGGEGGSSKVYWTIADLVYLLITGRN